MINVCLAADDGYAVHAGTVIASILLNSQASFVFYLIDEGISENNKKSLEEMLILGSGKIIFLEVSQKYKSFFRDTKTHKYITLPTYYRLILEELLPKEINRVIYLDCDVIVNDDLATLYRWKLEKGKVIGGVKDLNWRRSNEQNYINPGVMLVDLEAMRCGKYQEKLLNYIENNRKAIKLGDQEIINTVLAEKICLLPAEWNLQTSNFVNRSSYVRRPKIIHYVGKQKPWIFGSWNWYQREYQKVLDSIPWRIKKDKVWKMKGRIKAVLGYFKYRPFFWIRPRFYRAVWYTWFHE